jgi:tetratricopeptide (TPR) repeat protein
MPDTAHMKTCFVIIGYGRKTDPATGRSLDLDKTFEQFVQPACDQVGINAFRAIDANLTGSIDRLMHTWILLADYVIADLTTLNANVFYELGVRHALRPSTTLLLADRKLMSRIPFDLSSFIVHAYDHPDDAGAAGGDGAFEPPAVATFAELLQRVLNENARGEPESDSPVYDFLRGLGEPERPAALGDTKTPIFVDPAERAEKRRAEVSLADVISLAKEQARNRVHGEAVRLYRKAIELFKQEKPAGAKADVFLYQGLAEATYLHGETPDPNGIVNRDRAIASLREAERILQDHCALDITTDAGTLSIAGDIYRRLFRWDRRSEELRLARIFHWKCYRDLGRKFYFPFETRQLFESALDCYQRAWTSSDLRQYAASTVQVLLEVARSTWNPVLRLRYYAEAATARRRAGDESRQPGWASAIVLVLLLLGMGAGAHSLYDLFSTAANLPNAARDSIVLPPGPRVLLAEGLRVFIFPSGSKWLRLRDPGQPRGRWRRRPWRLYAARP